MNESECQFNFPAINTMIHYITYCTNATSPKPFQLILGTSGDWLQQSIPHGTPLAWCRLVKIHGFGNADFQLASGSTAPANLKGVIWWSSSTGLKFIGSWKLFLFFVMKFCTFLLDNLTFTSRRCFRHRVAPAPKWNGKTGDVFISCISPTDSGFNFSILALKGCGKNRAYHLCGSIAICASSKCHKNYFRQNNPQSSIHGRNSCRLPP